MKATPGTLLIDDEEKFARSLAGFLDTEGFAIDWANSWDSGLGMFRVGMHELVLADYNLPGSEHGLRLLTAIRKQRPSTKLVLISGALPADAQEMVSKSGLVDGFMRKDDHLGDQLLPLVREASQRLAEPTNWEAIADAYVERRRVSDGELEKIDAFMKGRLSKR